MQDDPKIAERRRGRQAKQAAETVAGLTIAERLTRRAKAQTVDIGFSDDEGVFTLVMRQPTRAEMDDLQKMQIAIQVEGTQDAANESLCFMLGDLCIDDSLSPEYWMEGNYSMTDLIDIVNKLFESLVERVKSAQTFRNK